MSILKVIHVSYETRGNELQGDPKHETMMNHLQGRCPKQEQESIYLVGAYPRRQETGI